MEVLKEWRKNASRKTKITSILVKSLKKSQLIKKRHSLQCWKNVIVFENQTYLQTRLKLMPRQVEEKLRSLYCRELQRALKRQKQSLVSIGHYCRSKRPVLAKLEESRLWR